MALIVLTSAHGSPGVTTTAMGLALAWPRPVLLVEADPTGASGVYAGYYRGGQEPTGGLIDLAVAVRSGGGGADLTGDVARQFDAHCVQLPDTAVRFLPGPRSHTQAPSLIPLWQPLANVLKILGSDEQPGGGRLDVLVDAGRLGLAGYAGPLLHRADLALLVTRGSLPALAGARSWAASLRQAFAEVGGEPRLAVLLVDEQDRWRSVAHHPRPMVRSYTPRQVTGALGLPVLGSLPWQPEVAEVYSHGAAAPRKFVTSDLVRSYRALAESIRNTVARNQGDLAPEGVPDGARGAAMHRAAATAVRGLL